MNDLGEIIIWVILISMICILGIGFIIALYICIKELFVKKGDEHV